MPAAWFYVWIVGKVVHLRDIESTLFIFWGWLYRWWRICFPKAVYYIYIICWALKCGKHLNIYRGQFSRCLSEAKDIAYTPRVAARKRLGYSSLSQHIKAPVETRCDISFKIKDAWKESALDDFPPIRGFFQRVSLRKFLRRSLDVQILAYKTFLACFCSRHDAVMMPDVLCCCWYISFASCDMSFYFRHYFTVSLDGLRVSKINTHAFHRPCFWSLRALPPSSKELFIESRFIWWLWCPPYLFFFHRFCYLWSALSQQRHSRFIALGIWFDQVVFCARRRRDVEYHVLKYFRRGISDISYGSPHLLVWSFYHFSLFWVSPLSKTLFFTPQHHTCVAHTPYYARRFLLLKRSALYFIFIDIALSGSLSSIFMLPPLRQPPAMLRDDQHWIFFVDFFDLLKPLFTVFTARWFSRAPFCRQVCRCAHAGRSVLPPVCLHAIGSRFSLKSSPFYFPFWFFTRRCLMLLKAVLVWWWWFRGELFHSILFP